MYRIPLPRQRACAAIVVALWLLFPLLGVVHAGAHAHRLCARHLTVEEAGPEFTGGHHASPHAEAGHTGTSEWLGGAAQGGLHEPCVLAWTGPRVGGLPARAEVLLCSPAPRELTGLRTGGDLPSPVALLCLAPKLSPPLG